MAAKSKWGLGIAILFGSFALFIISLVLYVSFINHELVEKDYYQKEMQYQDHIDKLNNTHRLNSKLKMELNQDTKIMTIKFPDINNQKITGIISFYRPSDVKLDYDENIVTDSSGIQTFNLSELNKGLWKLKINWSDNINYFYYEEKFFIN